MRFFHTALAGLAVVAAAPSYAALTVPSTPQTFDSIGDAATLKFNGFIEETLTSGLTASLSIKLASITGNSYTFDITNFTNTSSSPITASRISGFGFNTAPNVVSTTGTGVFNIEASGGVPQFGGQTNFEVCFMAGGRGNNCAGGGNGGLTLGQSIGSPGQGFTLTFANPVSSVVLDNFFVRYQSIAGSSLGSSGVGTVIPGDDGGGGNPNPIPEPSTWAMMIAGFGMVGAVRRRRRPTVAA